MIALGSGSVRAGSGELKAGAAARVINPSKPAAVVGHQVMRLFTDIYHDIRVQALVLEDQAGKRLVWMGYDFCIVHSSVVDRMKKQIQEKHGIRPEAVCINASHTHSAPPLTPGEAAAPEHFDPQYTAFVVRQAVAVVGDALARLAPARLRYVEDSSKIGLNRRCGTAGHIRSHCPNPKGITDPRVQIVAAESIGDGSLIGLVVKYAGHPVCVSQLGISSDYPGCMRQILEESHPGAVVVFLQGCGGQVVVRDPNEKWTAFARASVKQAEKYGRQLAEAVERALKKPGRRIIGPIEAEFSEIDLPVRKVPLSEYEKSAARKGISGRWGKMFLGMIKRGEKIPQTSPYRIQAFRLGSGKASFTLVALAGEVFCEYGLNLDRMLQPAATMVLGYSNGTAAYLPTAQAINEGGYEPQAYHWLNFPGPYSREAESIVLQTAAQLARPKSNAPK